jgi:sarcosine oxidase, subunit gamma
MPDRLFDARAKANSPITALAGVPGAMRIADLSLWPRAGLKGRGASAWLASRDARLPAINTALPQRDGSLLARLGENEYLALAGSDRAAGIPCGLPDFALDGSPDPGLCPVPRFAADAWFALAGARLSEAFAKICGIDLRPHKFVDHSVAQAIVARTSAILVRDDLGTMVRFHVIADWSTAPYLWDVLVDAIAEYDGSIVTAASLLGAQRS